MSSLRQDLDVVPDTSKDLRRAYDTCVTQRQLHTSGEESTDEQLVLVSVSKSQTAISESGENEIMTNSRPLSLRQDVGNFDIRDYLIGRCVADTNPSAAAAAGDDDDCDEIDGDIDKTDKICSSKTFEDRRELSVKPAPPPTAASRKRFSDSELAKPPIVVAGRPVMASGAATLPSRSAACGSQSKRHHRWRLLRKALNLFSFDEATNTARDNDDEDNGGNRGIANANSNVGAAAVVAAADDDDAASRTAPDSGGTEIVLNARRADLAARVDTSTDKTDGSDFGAGTACSNDGGSDKSVRDDFARVNAPADDDDVQSIGDRTGSRSGDEQPPRLGAHSVSVESLPGLVPARCMYGV